MRRLVVDLMSSAPQMRLPAGARDRLIARTPEGWETVVVESPTISSGSGTSQPSDETLASIASAEAFFGYGVPTSLLGAAPQLRWAHSAAAGLGTTDTAAIKARGIAFTNSAGVYAEPIADTVLGGVLHFARGLDLAVRLQSESRWDQLPFTDGSNDIRELCEYRVLVIGAGGLGSAVARRFTVLGCRCIGVRRRPELGVPDGFAAVFGPDAIDGLLPEADVVVIAAPLTGESRAMMDAARFALLPAGAIVVNVARGDLIDDEALLAALRLGGLRGAVLDVFGTEPLPSASPFWQQPRVLVTPHVSGVSPTWRWSRALDLFEDNWKRWVSGEPLRNVVDLEAGY